MSFLRKLFGQKPQQKASPVQPPPPASVDSAKNSNPIRVYDDYGRELFITREKWRETVLEKNIRQSWEKPDALYDVIVDALNEGFRADIVPATEQLFKIDPNPSRGACIWGIVLMEEGRLDEAQSILEGYLAKHGADGVILTNLAKVFSKREQGDIAEETLWKGLQIDPNQPSGMEMYQIIHHKWGGQEAGVEALRRIAAVPGSWRAQIWLGRIVLERADLDGALSLYRDALSRINPPPTDALMQISGDLGNNGYLIELVQLITPLFLAEQHGLVVGNNLIKAHFDLGQFETAQKILEQLYALNRPDWMPRLEYWDSEITNARLDVEMTTSQNEVKIGIILMEGPVWLKSTSPANTLFSPQESEPISIAFLGGTSEAPSSSPQTESGVKEGSGRLSRALPLFLAEQTKFLSGATVRNLSVRFESDIGGFAVISEPWRDNFAADVAQNGDKKSDYIVISHLKAKEDPWVAQARLIRTIDGSCIGAVETEIEFKKPTEGVKLFTQKLFSLFERELGLKMTNLPPEYQIPEGEKFPFYLVRLEQLLSVRCSAIDIEEGRNSGLIGERSILIGQIEQSLEQPASLPVRLLMAETFHAMKNVRPDILPEFQEKIVKLQNEHPLPAPAQSVVQGILDRAFGTV